jgi:hypothetical protein
MATRNLDLFSAPASAGQSDQKMTCNSSMMIIITALFYMTCWRTGDLAVRGSNGLVEPWVMGK